MIRITISSHRGKVATYTHFMKARHLDYNIKQPCKAATPDHGLFKAIQKLQYQAAVQGCYSGHCCAYIILNSLCPSGCGIAHMAVEYLVQLQNIIAPHGNRVVILTRKIQNVSVPEYFFLVSMYEMMRLTASSSEMLSILITRS